MAKALVEHNGLTAEELQRLLTHTQSFINHVYHVRQDFKLKPSEKHIGACINHVDMKEYRQEFVDELVNTISEWVYSQRQAKKTIDELINEGRPEQNAQSKLRSLANKKFRHLHKNGAKDKEEERLLLQGQFGELLLFNFLQHFYQAIPLLRKMAITTSAGHERFGADAIHYKKENGKNILLLGESKAYTYNKSCQFSTAFQKALSSILTTYLDLNKELELYTYDDFLDPELEGVARAYKNGTLKDVEIHLACLVAYSETKAFEKNSEEQIKADIIKIISDRCGKIKDEYYQCFSGHLTLFRRINYIIFPFWELEDLIGEFKKAIGM